MTPKQLYARTPEKVDNALFVLRGYYFDHVPEVGVKLPSEDLNRRVEIRYYKDHWFYERRSWRLAGVFFDGAPVMVIQNAGREGEDFVGRVVTDLTRYRLLLEYLASLGQPEAIDVKAQDENQDIAGLTRFYGHGLDDSWWD